MARLAAVGAALVFFAAACGGDNDVADGQKTAASGQVPYDRAFIDAMVPHHREAIRMARAANERGLTQPALRAIAGSIITSQQREIDQMLGWREEWFDSRELGPILPDVLDVAETELGMEHAGAHEVTEATDVDATFAQLMIAHHRGAIAMAEVAAEQAQHAEVQELAAAIAAAQQREIGVLEEHAAGHHP